jgi:hypothetical protein
MDSYGAHLFVLQAPLLYVVVPPLLVASVASVGSYNNWPYRILLKLLFNSLYFIRLL